MKSMIGQRIASYLRFQLHAKSGAGFGVHSPFVFSFITDVKNEDHPYYAYKRVEYIRKNLLNDASVINVTDYGTGHSCPRKVCDIEKKSAKRADEAQLLFRMVLAYKPQTIFELGTCLGTTTLYLSLPNTHAKVYSFEGCPNLAKIAQRNIDNVGLENVHLQIGELSQTLPAALQEIKKLDFVFFDANHQKEPTLAYYKACSAKAHAKSIFVFDDIHWSTGMEEAWETIKKDPKVHLSIDLYGMGIIFFNPELKKEDYLIRL